MGHPPGFFTDLVMYCPADGHNVAVFVKNDEPGAGGALVHGTDIGCHAGLLI
jgi:hypothetical protein